jgi:hypothetical protein
VKPGLAVVFAPDGLLRSSSKAISQKSMQLEDRQHPERRLRQRNPPEKTESEAVIRPLSVSSDTLRSDRQIGCKTQASRHQHKVNRRGRPNERKAGPH